MKKSSKIAAPSKERTTSGKGKPARGPHNSPDSATNITIWPEWNEADVNAELQAIEKNKTSKHVVPFEDPEGLVDMPPSLRSRISSWKRPSEIDSATTFVVVSPRSANDPAGNATVSNTATSYQMAANVAASSSGAAAASAALMNSTATATANAVPAGTSTGSMSPTAAIPETPAPSVVPTGGGGAVSGAGVGANGSIGGIASIASSSVTGGGAVGADIPVMTKDNLPLAAITAVNAHLMNSECMRYILSQLIVVEKTMLSDESHVYDCIHPKNKYGVPTISLTGKYLVKLHWLGAYRKVTVDDRFPVDSNNRALLISSPSIAELWPLILSKALLKLISLNYTDELGMPESGDMSMSIPCMLTRALPHTIPLPMYGLDQTKLSGEVDEAWPLLADIVGHLNGQVHLPNYTHHNQCGSAGGALSDVVDPLAFGACENSAGTIADDATGGAGEANRDFVDGARIPSAVSIPESSRGATGVENPTAPTTPAVTGNAGGTGFLSSVVGDLDFSVVASAAKDALINNNSAVQPIGESKPPTPNSQSTRVGTSRSAKKIRSGSWGKTGHISDSAVVCAMYAAMQSVELRDDDDHRQDGVEVAAATIDDNIDIINPGGIPSNAKLKMLSERAASKMRTKAGFTCERSHVFRVVEVRSVLLQNSCSTPSEAAFDEDTEGNSTDYLQSSSRITNSGKSSATSVSNVGTSRLNNFRECRFLRIVSPLVRYHGNYQYGDRSVWTHELCKSLGVDLELSYMKQQESERLHSIGLPHDEFEAWVDYREFCSMFRNLTIYHRHDSYQHVDRVSFLLDDVTIAAAAPVASDASVPVLSPLLTVPSILMIDVDEFVESELLVTFSAFTTPRAHVDGGNAPQGTLLLHNYDWKSLVVSDPLLSIKTTSVQSAFLHLPVGRHFLRITADVPFGYSVLVSSHISPVVILEEAVALSQLDVNVTDYEGVSNEQPENTWFLLFLKTLYFEKRTFMRISLEAPLPLSSVRIDSLVPCHSQLRIINNDDGAEVPRLFYDVVPSIFEPNCFGYTIMADGKFPIAIPHSRWRLRVLTDGPSPTLGDPVYGLETGTSDVAAAIAACAVIPGKESFSEAPDYQQQEFSKNYVADKNNTMFRFVLEALHPRHVCLQLSVSNPNVFIKLMVLDGENVLATTKGRGHCVLPCVRFLPLHVVALPPFDSYRHPGNKMLISGGNSASVEEKSRSVVGANVHDVGDKSGSPSNAATATGHDGGGLAEHENASLKAVAAPSGGSDNVSMRQEYSEERVSSIGEASGLTTTHGLHREEAPGSNSIDKNTAENEITHHYIIVGCVDRHSWPHIELSLGKTPEPNEDELAAEEAAIEKEKEKDTKKGDKRNDKGKSGSKKRVKSAGKKSHGGDNDSTTESQTHPEQQLGWRLQIFYQDDASSVVSDTQVDKGKVSTPTISIVKDTKRDDQKAAIKAAWESSQAGRAAKAHQTRSRFLHDAENQCESLVSDEIRNRHRRPCSGQQHVLSQEDLALRENSVLSEVLAYGEIRSGVEQCRDSDRIFRNEYKEIQMQWVEEDQNRLEESRNSVKESRHFYRRRLAELEALKVAEAEAEARLKAEAEAAAAEEAKKMAAERAAIANFSTAATAVVATVALAPNTATQLPADSDLAPNLPSATTGGIAAGANGANNRSVPKDKKGRRK